MKIVKNKNKDKIFIWNMTQWRVIKDFTDYMIDPEGVIRKGDKLIANTTIAGSRRESVSLYKDGKHYSRTVSKLLKEAWEK